MAAPLAGRWRPAGAGMAAAAGLPGQLLGRGRQQPGVPFGLPGQRAGGAGRGQVEHRPQLGQPVQDVQAQRVLVPAVAEAGRQVPVPGPVHVLDPGAQLADRLPARLTRRASRTWGRAAAGSPPPPRGLPSAGPLERLPAIAEGRRGRPRAAWSWWPACHPAAAGQCGDALAGLPAGGGLRGWSRSASFSVSPASWSSTAVRPSGSCRPGHRRQLHG